MWDIAKNPPFIFVCALEARYCFIGRLLFCVTYGADIPQIRSRSRSLANHFVEPMRDRKHESLNHHLHRCPASLLQVLHVSHTSNLGTDKGIATNGSYFSEVISEQTVTEGGVNINRLNSHVIQAVLTGNAKLLYPKLKEYPSSSSTDLCRSRPPMCHPVSTPRNRGHSPVPQNPSPLPSPDAGQWI